MQGSITTPSNNENFSQEMEDCLLRCSHVLERLSGYRIDSYDLNDFTDSIETSFREELCNGNLPEPEPSSFEDWQNCQRLQPDESDILFTAGYNDCMNEAIRFLIEEEQMDVDHPMVRNLRAHLEEAKDRVKTSVDQCTDNSLNIPPRVPGDLIYDCYMAVNLLDSSSVCTSG